MRTDVDVQPRRTSVFYFRAGKKTLTAVRDYQEMLVQIHITKCAIWAIIPSNKSCSFVVFVVNRQDKVFGQEKMLNKYEFSKTLHTVDVFVSKREKKSTLSNLLCFQLNRCLPLATLRGMALCQLYRQ